MTMLTIQLLVEGFKSDTILRFQTEQRQMPKGQAPVTQSIRKSQTQERVDLLSSRQQPLQLFTTCRLEISVYT